MERLRYGVSDARSVMAQDGSDNGDRSDPELLFTIDEDSGNEEVSRALDETAHL